MMLRGGAYTFGDSIDTDVIIPGRYLHLRDPVEMAGHTFEGLDPEFSQRFKKGDILVAGKNFGCGSSREQAVICLKQVGVCAIIAVSFARIFFRNAINQGLPLVESPSLVAATTTGDELIIDLSKGSIQNRSKDLDFSFSPLPRFLQNIIDAGGLGQLLKRDK